MAIMPPSAPPPCEHADNGSLAVDVAKCKADIDHTTDLQRLARESLTPYICFISTLASAGGMLYGYNLVVAGGISIMNDFLKQFYPTILQNKSRVKHDNYCEYDNQVFQLFSSSLCLAALLSTFVAALVTRKLGHRYTMLAAGVLYMAGTIFGAAAIGLPMVILDRVFMGFGLGFANQAIPLYLSEIAPARHRGKLTMFFGMSFAIGIFIANLVNYLSDKVPWGWRLSFAASALPSMVLIIAGLVIVDTPQSLIARDLDQQARAVLQKLRGVDDVEEEFRELVEAHARTEKKGGGVLGTWGQIESLFSRHHRPQLAIGIAMPLFQQVSGYDAIMFYGPSLFSTAGFGDGAALYSTLITGFFAMVAALGATIVVDMVGRRRILLSCSAVMFAAMTAIAIILALELKSGTHVLPQGVGIAEVVVICVVVLAYKASWGPMAWVIPSEIFPQEIRSMGQSMVVCLNMLIKFIMAQSLLSMLCTFRFGLFLFFGGWILIMGICTYFFIPETKGIPIESISELWKQHWFWKRFTIEDSTYLSMSTEPKKYGDV